MTEFWETPTFKGQKKLPKKKLRRKSQNGKKKTKKVSFLKIRVLEEVEDIKYFQ